MKPICLTPTRWLDANFDAQTKYPNQAEYISVQSFIQIRSKMGTVTYLLEVILSEQILDFY